MCAKERTTIIQTSHTAANPTFVMPTFKASQLPDKVRLCLIAGGTGKTIRGMPVQLVIQSGAPEGRSSTIPIGLLASNHAGYLAFNLARRKDYLPESFDSIHAVIPIDPTLRVELTDKLVQLPSQHLSTLPRRRGQDVIPISVPGHDPSSHATHSGLNSVEDPDVADWVQSPGSFGADAVSTLGEEGCEVLLPSHAAERIVRFHQLVRTRSHDKLPPIRFAPLPTYGSTARAPEVGWPPELFYRTGELRHYELVWRPLGHALGKVLYSLTLAPCEAARLAVLEWSRSEEASRTELSELSDNLSHSIRRDRAVEEIVNAVLRERQSGESFLGGMAGVGGYGGGMGGGGMGMPIGGGASPGAGGSAGGATPAAGGAAQGGGQQAGQNWGITGSHSLGYALANSTGNREVDVETTQNLVDEIAQASHLVRDLRSTVIVQANQSERATASTRIVRNHNHSHALTVLYYEVVRHYLVQAARRRTRPVIFIRYPSLTFDEATAYKHRRLLSQELRARHLVPNFDILAESFNDSGTDLRYFNEGRISSFIVTLTCSDDDIAALDRMLLQILSAGRSAPVDFRFPGGEMRPFTTRTLALSNPDGTLRYRDIVQIGLLYSVEGDGEARERASIQGLEVKALVVVDGVPRLFDLLASTVRYKYENTSTFWQDPNRKRDATSLTRRDEQSQRTITELLDHLRENQHHYSALIWLQESAHERAARFEDYGFDGGTLLEAVDNRPIEAVGDYLVFPLGGAPEDERVEEPVERIVSLPTRGAFAEAKLAHCNASEIIDDTRFWDWQISPCPDEPTEIQPIPLDAQRASITVMPTTLPASGVGISEPQTAPEPFGMREVMQLLRTPEVFRDMSGIEQLGPLLQKLVEVAGEVEKARIGATTELARGTPSATPGSPATESHVPRAAATAPTAASSSPQNEARHDAIVERAIERVEDPDVRRELNEEHARTSMRRSTRATTAEPTVPAAEPPPPSRNLTFQIRDHRGGPLAVTGYIQCQDVQSGQTLHASSNSPVSGEHAFIIRDVPAATRQVRLEFFVESLYLNVLSTPDLGRLDGLFDGRLRMISGTRRIYVSQPWRGVTPSDGWESGVRTVRMLGSADAVLDPGNLQTFSYVVQLATETRTISRSTTRELREALETELSGSVERGGLAVEISAGRSTEDSSSGTTQVSVDVAYTQGHFRFRRAEIAGDS